MKKILFALGVLCAIVCSCEKEPQELLIGRWEVTYTYTTTWSMTDKTASTSLDYGIWVFNDNGRVMRIFEDSVIEYTYSVDKASKTIYFNGVDKNSDYIAKMEIVSLTKNSFVFRDQSNLITVDVTLTVNGKRVE